MQMFTDETRAAIALGWEKSGLPQDEYAQQFGIAGRTLRLWLSRHASDRPPLDEARAILVAAVGRLQSLLAAVDAQSACRPAGGGSSSPGSAPACRPAAAREVIDATATATTSSAAPSVPPGTRHAGIDALMVGVQREVPKKPNEPSAPNAVTVPAPRPERRLRTGGVFADMDVD
jgi:hypothetical protein